MRPRTHRRLTTTVASGFLALAIALLCTLSVAASAAADSHMTSSNGVPMVGPTTGTSPQGTSVSTTRTQERAVGDPSVLGGMCDGVCATQSTATCAVIVLTVVSVLGLLLGRRRDTYLGLTARQCARSQLAQTERQRPPRWTVLTLTDLCVLRV